MIFTSAQFSAPPALAFFETIPSYASHTFSSFCLSQRHLMQYKARLEECLVKAKLAEGLRPDASNESLLPKSARRHIFPR